MGLLVRDEEYIPIALSMLQGARSSIYISTFKAEDNIKPFGVLLRKFFYELTLLAKKGIKIKVLLNWNEKRHSVAKTNFSVAQKLKGCGVEVKHLRNNRCCHAKLLIIDRVKALLGSHNLSIRSVSSNFELSYLIPDPESVRQLSSVFEQSFLDAQKF